MANLQTGDFGSSGKLKLELKLKLIYLYPYLRT